MDQQMNQHRIADIASLEALYDAPAPRSVTKEVDYIHPHYRAFIEAAPFAVLATGGPEGLDASPRGDPAGFILVQDDKTLLIPDRRGNNRLDSLRNIVADPRVALLFLIPGVGETLRINGQAHISTEPALLDRFEIDGKPPRSVIVVHVEAVYFHCSRALLRSKLWDPSAHVKRDSLPSTGTILAALHDTPMDGAAYDRELPERLKTTLY
jgi:PPOX class probable FMN-dependent enzyme